MLSLPKENFRSPLALICFGTDGHRRRLSRSVDQGLRLRASGHLPRHESHRLTSQAHHPRLAGDHRDRQIRGAVFGLGAGQRAALRIRLAGARFCSSRISSPTAAGSIFISSFSACCLAGVIGNLYDRIVLGYVRDMIHALPKWGVSHGFSTWPM